MKVRALFACGIATVTFIAAFIACSDDDGGSKFGGPGTEDANIDSGPGFQTEGSVPEDGGAPKCNPHLSSNFEPTWTAPTAKPTACNGDQLAAYYDNCIGTQILPDGGDKCSMWMAANKNCSDCIETKENTGPIQWYADRTIYTANFGGCMALTRNEPNPGQCPALFNASIQCQTESCVGCEFVSREHFRTEFASCRQKALTTGCTEQGAAWKPVCNSKDSGVDASSDDVCFPLTDASPPDTEKAGLIRIMKVFCSQ
jgi:hypothetical protein